VGTRTRLRKTLVDERTRWLERIQATLFHHGVSGAPARLLGESGREFLAGLELPDSARERIEVAVSMIAATEAQLTPLERELRAFARRQAGFGALRAHGRRSNRRPSGRSRSSRIDPSTITSPTVLPSTQISPGVRGAIGPMPASRLHSRAPPNATEALVQMGGASELIARRSRALAFTPKR
jgi:hypothetical protein